MGRSRLPVNRSPWRWGHCVGVAQRDWAELSITSPEIRDRLGRRSEEDGSRRGQSSSKVE